MSQDSNYIGYVTHASPDQLRGFAFDRNKSEPVEVSVFVNGEQVGQQLAVLPATMLEEREMPANHGFHFDMKSLGAFHIRDHIEVRVGQEVLPFAPHIKLVRHKLGFSTNKVRELYFFMHIPKTAGTSFRMLLNRQFDQHEIWPNREDLSLNNRKYPDLDNLRNLDQNRKLESKLMMGHYPMWVLRFMDVRPEILTFLRKPQDQILSLARHKQQHTPQLKNKSLEFIVENAIAMNPQAHFFLPAHMSGQELTDEHMRVAVQNLERCAFVGIRERFDEALLFLEKKYDWKLGKRIKKNVGGKIDVHSELNELVQIKTQGDQKLYNYAQFKFNNLLSQNNII